MERIWLKQYPAGIPADIDLTQYTSLVQLLEESFAKFSDRKSFICMDKSITYRDLDQISLALAAYLQSKGLQKGARVALMMPNVLQYPVSTTAVLRAGYAVVNVNPLYTPRELEHQLKDSGAEAIVVLENFATTVQQVIPRTAVKHVIIASMGDMLGLKGMIVNFAVRRVKKMVPPYSIPGAVAFNDAVAAGRGKRFSKPAIGPDDVAFLQYTGGTTGVSKGATLLHRNILANVLQNDAWLQPALSAPPHIDQLFIVCALPLYHIFALTACFLLAVRAGGVNLLIPNPRDMAGFVKELKKYKVNSFPAVNTLYNALLHTPGFNEIDFSKLKSSFGGGMATQKAVADGYFRTGDIGVMSADGFTKIVDRKKDMILVSGFNVYPNEVEDVIAMHPGVLEVAVIGVPDPHSTEVVKAFVVKKDPNLTAQDIVKFAATQLTGYKVPKQIEFRNELPKTNVGKIMRHELP